MGLSRLDADKRIFGNDLVNSKFIYENTNIDNHTRLTINVWSTNLIHSIREQLNFHELIIGAYNFYNHYLEFSIILKFSHFTSPYINWILEAL